MSQSNNETVSYEQLKEENKLLGNIITSLKFNKAKLEKQNKKLQNDLRQISKQQQIINSENETLRNITADLKQKLQRNKENEIHCLKQQIHKLEMEKIDILKHNQQFVIQLKDVVNEQQILQQKICNLENENVRLRQNSIESNPKFIKFGFQQQPMNKNDNIKENGKETINNVGVTELGSFEDIINEIKKIEKENKYEKDLKFQLYLYNQEIQKLKELLIMKQNENQSLYEKYTVILQQYELLCHINK